MDSSENTGPCQGTEYLDGDTVRKLKYSDFGLLFRSIANEAGHYIEALDEMGIPSVYSGTGGLFCHRRSFLYYPHLQYISECDSDTVYNEDFLRDIHSDLPTPFSLPLKQFKSAILKRQEWAKRQRRLSCKGFMEVSFHS